MSQSAPVTVMFHDVSVIGHLILGQKGTDVLLQLSHKIPLGMLDFQLGLVQLILRFSCHAVLCPFALGFDMVGSEGPQES